MNCIAILFGGSLSPEAYKPLHNGKNSIELAQEQTAKFPGVTKTVLLEEPFPSKRALLDKIAGLQTGFDFAYFAFADCPFLDPVLAGKLAERHTRFKAEYTYADGWPIGLAPEILAPGTAAILSKIIGENENTSLSKEPVKKDFLFSVLQKDINAFDIETEISGIDLRCHRLNLCADSKRNYLLLNNFLGISNRLPTLDTEEKIPSACDIEKIIQTNPEILRTLPAFYPIQVYGGCPDFNNKSDCSFCPYPSITDAAGRKDFMPVSGFENLLDKIIAFSGDAVIDLSLWGELSLHPEKLKLIDSVVSRKGLSLCIETSGIGWNTGELEKCLDILTKNKDESPGVLKLSWIVSIINSESETCAKKLFELFPETAYVQAIRTKGSEDETEKFYRSWKNASPNGDKNIIIQKYDDFCGFLEKKQASDISPVIRQPCWHLMRDMPVLIDGSVPLCRSFSIQTDPEKKRILGNVFKDELHDIWKNGGQYYTEHINKNYAGICADCDEYYTFNF